MYLVVWGRLLPAKAVFHAMPSVVCPLPRGTVCSGRSPADWSSLIISKEVAMVRPHLKWLSVPLAFFMTLGAWAAPADAGVIPWVYNAIFGPARNGPYGAMYGGGAYYGPRYYGRTYARYGGFDGGCGYGGCGTPAYGYSYGASYGVPVYGGYDLGCGSCGTCGSYGGCSTGTCGGGGCGTSYYAGGYGTPVYGMVGNCGVGCGVGGACAPNVGVGLQPVPQSAPAPGAYPAGAAPAANPGFAPAPGAGAAPQTYDPNGMNMPAGSNRTAPGSGFAPASPAPARNPLGEESGGGFKPTTPIPPAAPGTGASSEAAPATPATPASNGTKPPSILGDDDVNVGPVAREDKVARVTFERMRISASNRDARLVRIDPALPSAAVAVARK